jgi:glycosyltransferase involved in cell wall biosynthesis
MRISLCLVVWNELEGCMIDVPNLPLNAFEEVYAVDGSSRDGTVEYLTAQGIPVYSQSKKGLNQAYIEAFKRSSCDAVVVFFPKGTLPTESLLNFRKPLEEGYDIVLASRNIRGGRNEEDTKFFKPRKWLVLCMAYFVALLWRREGHLVRDVLHGYKGLTVEAFKKIAPLDRGLSIDLETVVRSYRLRLKRIEIPVIETGRGFGQTNFHILPTGVELLKYLIFEWKRGSLTPDT